MLKNILIKCTELLGRDDLKDALETYDDTDNIENKNQQNDILKLINFFNYTMHFVSENYIDLTMIETLKSDQEGKLYYYNFCFTPNRIFCLKTKTGHKVVYEITPNFLKTNYADTVFEVTYKYTPNECKSLVSEPDIPKILNTETLCYGVVSEFLASKGQYQESEFWKKKFLNRLFKSKLQRERRIKSTY